MIDPSHDLAPDSSGLRRQPRTAARRHALRALVVALVSLLILLGTLEIGLRAVGDRIWHRPLLSQWTFIESDPVIGWRNKPGFEEQGVRIGRTGFRGAEVPIAKPAGTRRIVCLGDSGTYGITRVAEDRHSFVNHPDEMAKIYSERGRGDIEVLNAGVIGYSTGHGTRQLATRLLRYEPDVVTVRFGFNDHSSAWNPALRANVPRSPWVGKLLQLAAETGIGKLVLHAIKRMGALHPAPNSVRWSSPEQLERNLARIVEIAEQAGVRVLFVDYPLREGGRGEPTTRNMLKLLGVADDEALDRLHDEYQLRQARVAERLGVPLLRTGRICAERPDGCFGHYDKVHPSPQGQRVIAEAIVAQLDQLGWLDDETSDESR